VESLIELNPMLGHRGCRLGIVYPEITTMQARALFEAACRAVSEGIKVLPEIMIPLVGHEKEFLLQKEVVDRVAKEVMAKTKTKVKYQVGVMIELPRACLVADRIVKAGAQFFSFGTNDLTQTTYGLSRDDAGHFLPNYLDMDIWEHDPFVTIDPDSTGLLVEMGIERGRKADKNLKIGICGEHGGDPASVSFCAKAGMDYVSCSPFRVPVASLAAAQANIHGKAKPVANAPAQKIGKPSKPQKKASAKAK
jgi:pyruvate,orthophosphate dikinase